MKTKTTRTVMRMMVTTTKTTMMMMSMTMMMMLTMRAGDDFCVSWQVGRSLFLSRQFRRHVASPRPARRESPGFVALGSCFG